MDPQSFGDDAARGATDPGKDETDPSIPTAESGNAVPTPLKKEDKIRAEEAIQSAHELSEAAHSAPQDEPGKGAAPGTSSSRRAHDDGKSG
jgi:hypothetical protein